MDPKYGEKYRELYEKHWWWRARTEFIVDELHRLYGGSGTETILDVGCGDGLFFDHLATFGEVEGVEPDAALVSDSNPHRARIYTCAFDEHFQPGKQYSLILMLDVLEHLDDPGAALLHVSRLLRSGGRLMLTVPAFRALWTNHDVLNYHRTRYSKTTFRAVARTTDLRIDEEKYLYHWTYPAKLGVRLMEGIVKSEPRPPRIPHNWLNQALYRLSRFEQKTISHLPIPFGSSLFILATKP